MFVISLSAAVENWVNVKPNVIYSYINKVIYIMWY